MGLLGKFLEKKICSICGDEIKLLGNRKLEDGNLCKNCSAKLSPWFSDRRSSTVEEIQAQLAYREKNKAAVAAFNVTRSLGENTKVLIDEDAGKFMVTRARDLKEANPDVIDFAQVTGVELEIEDKRDEAEFKDKEGHMTSYVPPRYHFAYDFNIEIRVNHPYFDHIEFQLNPSTVELNPDSSLPENRMPNPQENAKYREYEEMGLEIKRILTNARKEAREEAKAAAAPKKAVACPHCGATTLPDANGCCEYCGGSLNG